MLKFFISVIANIITKFLGMKKQQSVESENEALKGRADSVEDSFSEQEKARKEAEEAKKKVENQGSDDDVFGADEWNGEKKDEQPKT